MPINHSPRHSGFILVTTLWLLAVITIAASFFALWTQRTLELAFDLQQNIQGDIDVHNTQTYVIYLMTAHRFSTAGLKVEPPGPIDYSSLFDDFDWSGLTPVGNELAVDDRVYQGLGNAYFAIQDESGLINLNVISLGGGKSFQRQAYRLLGLLGVPSAERNPLLDKLQDYTDPDDFHRLNGAEASHYQQLGLPPPPNRTLLNPMECRHILDWDKYETLWEEGIWGQLTTTAQAGFINLNAAPLQVLQSLDNINAEAARRIVARRQELVFTNPLEFSQAAGVQVGSEQFMSGYKLIPSDYFRLTVWHKEAKQMQQIHLQLTPNVDESKPWRIDYILNAALRETYSQADPIKPDRFFFENLEP